MTEPSDRASQNSSQINDGEESCRQTMVHADEATSASSINPDTIEGLFLLALQKAPAERMAFVDDACGTDPERHRRVTALLRAFDDAGSFLEAPAVGQRPEREVSLSFLKPANKDGVLGTIGPYEVLEVIGRGGMGVVLRAVDPKLNRVVAVKVLLPELAANPNARRRFLREAQAAAAISHPHVVTIHAVDDSHEDANGKPVPPYLVMECVVGQSLQQKLDRVGTLRIAEILRIGRQIGDGLAAAHKQGVIHRDIKPANILLENGVERVKITDFGLARATDDITVTRTGEVSGTPQYMSPEQASGERVDHRSDLFSLGCVMYAMCTGHSPFRGDSIVHVIKRVTQDTPRSIAEQNPEIPRWLIEIITCLLLKNPKHRFQTAAGVVAILDEHLARIQHPTESGSHSVINQQIPATKTAVAPIGDSSESLLSVNSKTDRRTSRAIWGRRLLWMSAIIAAVAIIVLFVYASHAAYLQWLPITAQFYIPVVVAVLGLSVLLALAGVILSGSTSGDSPSTSVLAFYLLLGPLGIVLWLMDRERRDTIRRTSSTPANPATPASAADEVASPQTVSMQFGAAVVQNVPIENYLHYAAIRRLGMTWILMALGAAVFSFLSMPQPMLMQTPFEKIIQRLGEQATIVLIGWAVTTAVVSRQRQMSSPMFGFLSSSSSACILAGYFWATILRIPAANGGAMLQTVIGMAVLPTICVFVLCGYVLRVMSRSEEFRKQSATPTTSARTLVWLLPFIFGCMLLSRWFNGPLSSPGHVGLTPEEIHGATEFVAQRFRRPVLSVVTAGNSNASVVLKAENGSEQRIHLKKSVTGLWELDPAHHATVIEVNKGDSLGPINEEWGGLIVPELDPGLHLALIGNGPRVLGFAPPMIPQGRHKVPAGSYTPLIFDSWAGWLGDVKSNPQGDYQGIYRTIDMTMSGLDIGTSLYDAESGTWSVSQYTADPSPFEIKAGGFTTVTARRDLRKIAAGSACFNQDATHRFVAGQFYRFLWNGRKYSLSADQAIVVDFLLKRLADGQLATLELEVQIGRAHV